MEVERDEITPKKRLKCERGSTALVNPGYFSFPVFGDGKFMLMLPWDVSDGEEEDDDLTIAAFHNYANEMLREAYVNCDGEDPLYVFIEEHCSATVGFHVVVRIDNKECTDYSVLFWDVIRQNLTIDIVIGPDPRAPYPVGPNTLIKVI